MTDEKEDSPPKNGEAIAAEHGTILVPNELGEMLRRLRGSTSLFPENFKQHQAARGDVLRRTRELSEKLSGFSNLGRAASVFPGSLAEKAIFGKQALASRLLSPLEGLGALAETFRQTKEALARLEERDRELVWDFFDEQDAGEAFGWVLECARLTGDDVEAFRRIVVTAARFGLGEGISGPGETVKQLREKATKYEEELSARRQAADTTNEQYRLAADYAVEEAKALFAAHQAAVEKGDAKEELPRMGELCRILQGKIKCEFGLVIDAADTIRGYLNTAEKDGRLAIPPAVRRSGRPKKKR